MKEKRPRTKPSLAFDKDALLAEIPVVPGGVKLSKDEMGVWVSLTAARQVWEEFELISIARACQLEINNRKLWKRLMSEGPTVMKPSGEEKENPLVGVLTKQQAMFNSILTKLRIQERRRDVQTLNKSRPPADAYESKTSPASSLLAFPKR